MKIMYTIKYFFSFIFLCGISLTSQADPSKGDSLYASGNYFEASIAFERLLFSADSSTNIALLNYKKALCYRKMKQFDRAITTLQSIYFPNPKDSLYRLVSYEQSLCYYLHGEPARALWKIDEYFHRSVDSTTFSDFLPIKILSLHEAFKWEGAERSFVEFVALQQFPPEKEKELKQMAAELYDKKNRPRTKSVHTAENWSRFIPGAGQMYAGNTGEGILNLLINASVLSFAGIQIYKDFYITGYLAGLGFFNKTYHGGIKRAGIIARQNNKKNMAEFNLEVNRELLSILRSK